jgi:hypothetical protein
MGANVAHKEKQNNFDSDFDLAQTFDALLVYAINHCRDNHHFLSVYKTKTK